MTQINKGKNRELNPLYSRKNASLSNLINASKQQSQPYNLAFNAMVDPASMHQPEGMVFA